MMNKCVALLAASFLFGCFSGQSAAACTASSVQVIDSRMTEQEAFDGLAKNCPEKIRKRQKLIAVEYCSFDNKLHRGQILTDKELEKDIKTVFEMAKKENFPIYSVIPISDKRFRKNGIWDDDISMAKDNTSAFNYRLSAGSSHLSQHAYGRAIDINPVQNPYVKNGLVLPKGAKYDRQASGTLTKNHPLVKAFLRLGWTWGGNWTTLKDYQHFQKPLQ